MSADLFGFTPPRPEFLSIHRQNDKVVEEKAILRGQLRDICGAPPRSLNSASINRVRAWKETHKRALKVLNSKASSRMEPESALNMMRGFE